MEPVDADTPMVVTECPECSGLGYVDDAAGDTSGSYSKECSHPAAFYDEIGVHVVPVETLDADPEADLDDDDDEDPFPDVPVESGPEAGGMTPVAGHAPADDEVLLVDIDWPDDPIGVVTVGDNNGLAHVVTRALGGVEGPFTAELAELVNEAMADCGLEDYPENTVVGKAWALVLPPITVGTRGQVARWLCKALELPSQNVVDIDLMTEAILRANPARLKNLTVLSDVEDAVSGYEWDAIDWMAIL